VSRRIALATIAMDRMAGGLERNITYLANHLAERGHQVVLLTFDQPDARAFYDLHPSVAWERLGRAVPHTPIGFRQRLDLIARMRKALVSHGVATVVCFHHGILARYFLASIGRPVAIVCSERNSLTIYDFIRARRWNLNFALLFLVDAITVQFPSYVTQYPRALQRKIAVIHNPVYPVDVTEASLRRPVILSAGRHVAQKRFDLLVRAFALLLPEFPEWKLAIVGDGPLKASLEGLISDLGIGAAVELRPATPDLRPFFQAATVYCQPSQWEGFPNAMAEAMAGGVIPTGFVRTSGVSDLVENGVNGFLAEGEPSPEGLAQAIRKVIAAPEHWGALSARARSISDTYSPVSWASLWDRLIATVGGR
jgi:glycosyltransferase involved in cell wall biosynthesis